jgi:hypothetical protein
VVYVPEAAMTEPKDNDTVDQRAAENEASASIPTALVELDVHEKLESLARPEPETIESTKEVIPGSELLAEGPQAAAPQEAVATDPQEQISHNFMQEPVDAIPQTTFEMAPESAHSTVNDSAFSNKPLDTTGEEPSTVALQEPSRVAYNLSGETPSISDPHVNGNAEINPEAMSLEPRVDETHQAVESSQAHEHNIQEPADFVPHDKVDSENMVLMTQEHLFDNEAHSAVIAEEPSRTAPVVQESLEVTQEPSGDVVATAEPQEPLVKEPDEETAPAGSDTIATESIPIFVQDGKGADAPPSIDVVESAIEDHVAKRDTPEVTEPNTTNPAAASDNNIVQNDERLSRVEEEPLRAEVQHPPVESETPLAQAESDHVSESVSILSKPNTADPAIPASSNVAQTGGGMPRVEEEPPTGIRQQLVESESPPAREIPRPAGPEVHVPAHQEENTSVTETQAQDAIVSKVSSAKKSKEQDAEQTSAQEPSGDSFLFLYSC